MIVATAGHVDHGKTSLVKALTGVDTDKLEEEKRRGLTIDLGFAYRSVKEGVTLGFVDVPGHSRFINTMIAGVSGIDLGLLVVAADDGPMPQTLEHLELMRILGIAEFAVVVTKVDRVDADRVAEVIGVLDALVPECVQTAFCVSNASGAGLPELQAWLDERALAFDKRKPGGNFRMPVDRAFSLKGVGLVVTGTAIAGRVAPGDELEVLPEGERVRVRSLRVQDGEASTGQTGDRCALNIVGASAVQRGSTLATIDSLSGSSNVDARFSLLATAPFPLKHLSPVKLYIGTRRLACRLFYIEPVDGGQLNPGGSTLVQLILTQDVHCCAGDRFLIRDDSESVTLGGGVVLDPLAPKTGKSREHRLAYLRAMELDSPSLTLEALLTPNSPPLNLSQLRMRWNITAGELQQLLPGMLVQQFEVSAVPYAVSMDYWSGAQKTLLTQLQQWHKENPQEKGIAALKLQRLFVGRPKSESSAVMFKAVVNNLVRGGKLGLAGGLIRSTDNNPVLSKGQQGVWEAARLVLVKQGIAIPTLLEVSTSTGLDTAQLKDALRAAASVKLAHRVNENRYGLSESLLAQANIVSELDKSDEGITVISFKNRLGCGRKLAIDILEYFDAQRFTQRRGDRRVIIDGSIPAALFGE